MTAATATHPSVPAIGTYLTDVDYHHLYRIEDFHKKDGVVLEDCRTLARFMLTVREFEKANFQELECSSD